MLQILEGKLAYAPEISKVNTEHGEKECCNMKLHVYAGLNDPAPVIVKINAWEDCARDLANYRKGDIIQFIGETKTFAGIGEEGSSLGDTVKKIDREGSLLKKWNAKLTAYLSMDKNEEMKKGGVDRSAHSLKGKER